MRRGIAGLFSPAGSSEAEANEGTASASSMMAKRSTKNEALMVMSTFSGVGELKRTNRPWSRR